LINDGVEVEEEVTTLKEMSERERERERERESSSRSMDGWMDGWIICSVSHSRLLDD